jgi:hypothetical protein
MLTAQLCGTGKRWRPLPDALALLWQAAAWRDELSQLLLLLAERSGRRLHPLPWALPIPVRVHGRYSRAEIEAAYCFAEAWRLRDPARRRPLDSPRRPPLARTQPDRPGPRPVPVPLGKPEHHHRRLPQRPDVTEPFRCLGFARYESHQGERPMAIRWRLERPIPAGWMQGMALAV